MENLTKIEKEFIIYNRIFDEKYSSVKNLSDVKRKIGKTMYHESNDNGRCHSSEYYVPYDYIHFKNSIHNTQIITSIL